MNIKQLRDLLNDLIGEGYKDREVGLVGDIHNIVVITGMLRDTGSSTIKGRLLIASGNTISDRAKLMSIKPSKLIIPATPHLSDDERTELVSSARRIIKQDHKQ